MREAAQRRPRRLLRRRGLTILSLAPVAPITPAAAPDPEITRTAVRLRRLPGAYEGLRIVHITDIHHGLFTPLEDVERVVELANDLRPDLIALTGDYVTFSAAYVLPVARALGKLRARLGVFAVLGNHDFQVDPDKITQALRSGGVRVLRNARHPLRPIQAARLRPESSARLWLVGVDDLWSGLDDLPRALNLIPVRDPKVLLCHNPLGIWHAVRHGIDLMLSGHTHGGQVRLPGFRSLYRSKPGKRFVDGWNRLDGTQIYVSRGIGKVVLPFRVACPPEIACIELLRE